MKLNVSSIEDLNSAIQDNNILMVDVKFTDLFGQWHHFTMPVEEFDADDAVNEGLGFDGSSIRGFQSIENSGHGAAVGSHDRDHRPDLRHADAERDL